MMRLCPIKYGVKLGAIVPPSVCGDWSVSGNMATFIGADGASATNVTAKAGSYLKYRTI